MRTYFCHICLALSVSFVALPCYSLEFVQGSPPPVMIKQGYTPRDNLLTGAQLTKEEMNEAAKLGFKRVINLRTFNESPSPEETGAWAREAGMEYLSFPVGATDINLSTAKRLFLLLNHQNSTPTILHCSSGNRVGALFALYAYFEEGKSQSEALVLGEAIGLTTLKSRVTEQITQGDQGLN